MISFVCGQLCSGKTLYSKALAETCNGVYIEIGDVVRQLKMSLNRNILQDSERLKDVIIAHLSVRINFHEGRDIVISGARQVDILKAFPKATLLWINCPPEVRKTRYAERSRTGDSQAFEEAEQGDIKLGILEVKQYIFNKQ